MSQQQLNHSGKRARSAQEASRILRSATLAAAVAVTSQSATAATLYWDIDGVTAGGSGTTTATGTWGTNNFWSTDPNGAVATTAWNPDPLDGDDIAVFSAGNDVTGATTVTVSGTQTTAGMIFEEANITLTGGALTLSGADPTLTIGTGTAGRGIRINTILPGIFETPLMMGAPEKVKEALAASVPFPKRLGNPQEYASLALEMIRNPYFNGEDVRLDGAIRMGLR